MTCAAKWCTGLSTFLQLTAPEELIPSLDVDEFQTLVLAAQPMFAVSTILAACRECIFHSSNDQKAIPLAINGSAFRIGHMHTATANKTAHAKAQ